MHLKWGVMDRTEITTMLFIFAGLMVVASISTIAAFTTKHRSERDVRVRGIRYGHARASLVLEDVPLGVQAARKDLESSLASKPRFRLLAATHDSVSVRGRANYWTSSTLTTITFDGTDDSTRVSFVTAPRRKTILVDWGQSSRDVWELARPFTELTSASRY
jgi:hypothetical protein